MENVLGLVLLYSYKYLSYFILKEMEHSSTIPYEPVDIPAVITDDLVNSIAETVDFTETDETEKTEKAACTITRYIVSKQIHHINTIQNLDESQIARIAFVIARNHDLMNNNQDFPTLSLVYQALTDIKKDAQLRDVCGETLAGEIIRQPPKAPQPNAAEAAGGKKSRGGISRHVSHEPLRK
jgi:hypothetical protein